MAAPFSADIPDLLERHYDMLVHGSGIAPDVLRERGYRSILSKAELQRLGFTPRQRRIPGLLLPICPPDGSGGLACYRPDIPRETADGKVSKYELPAGTSARLDVPPRCRPALADPAIPLWITEGQKKADALASRGAAAAALLGVWNFLGRDETGSVKLLADFDYVAWNRRRVYIVFDSDVMLKPQVRRALDRLTEHLQRKGAQVSAVYLPAQPDGTKCGVDDFLLTRTLDDLLALVEQPRPAPRAAPPVVELLDAPPPVLTRPLQLVEGRGYAVTWLWTRTVRRETFDEKTGAIIMHDPPLVQVEQRQFVIRDDGTIFGEGGDAPLAELGCAVAIPAPPREGKCWRAAGVRAYHAGERPDPVDVFTRLCHVIDRFMAFDHSLADQQTMCELVACYILSTWFLDALDVTGFLWPNGPSGSGKTKLGLLVCELAYLGEAILAGSTYASLRDLADLGATLLFDDAEGLTDPRRTDPDKRNLLLAGNRRGAFIAVKEPRPDGTWGTRYVNAYCPRLFTAINLPDPVLASRTLVIPLVRTAAPEKANADVLDEATWPCERGRLLDDCWALALAHLAQMPAHVAAVNRDAPLVGRALEPWKGVLAVAHWLTACALAQQERQQHEEQGEQEIQREREQAGMFPEYPAHIALFPGARSPDVSSLAPDRRPQSAGNGIPAYPQRSASAAAAAGSPLTTLYPRLCTLARQYQIERASLETPDLVRLVLRALCDLVATAQPVSDLFTPLTPVEGASGQMPGGIAPEITHGLAQSGAPLAAPHCPINPINPIKNGAPPLENAQFVFSVGDVTARVNELAREDDLTDQPDHEYTSVRKVGRILTALRFPEAPKRHGKRRMRIIPLDHLATLAQGYGIPFTPPMRQAASAGESAGTAALPHPAPFPRAN